MPSGTTSTATGDDLVARYDPFHPDVMANPLPFYEQLRAHSPVHYLPQYDTFAVSRFQDVWDVLGDTSGTFVSSESSLPSPQTLRAHNGGPVADPPTNPMGSANMFGSPVYEDFRHAQGKPLRPGGVKRLEAFMRDRARTRLADLLAHGDTFDLTQDLGGHLASGVICHILGLPPDLAPVVQDIVNSSTRTNETDGGKLDKEVLFRRSIETLVPAIARHRSGDIDTSDDGAIRSGMIDGMLEFEFEGRRLNDTEIAINLVCVFVGGTETVPKVTAHGLWELARHPDQLAAVRADLETTVPVAREEFVRYCAPAQWFLRTVRRPTEIAGVAVEPGQRVMMLMGSAARDETEFEHAHEFRWDRPIERVLSFGRGQHFCIGFHLARLEVTVLAQEFLRAVDGYEIDEAAAQRPPSSFQWGWNSLPVRVTERNPDWAATTESEDA